MSQFRQFTYSHSTIKNCTSKDGLLRKQFNNFRFLYLAINKNKYVMTTPRQSRFQIALHYIHLVEYIRYLANHLICIVYIYSVCFWWLACLSIIQLSKHICSNIKYTLQHCLYNKLSQRAEFRKAYSCNFLFTGFILLYRFFIYHKYQYLDLFDIQSRKLHTIALSKNNNVSLSACAIIITYFCI